MNRDKPALDDLRIDRSADAKPRASARWALLVVLLLLLGAGAAIWWWKQPGTILVRTARAREVAGSSATTVLNASGYVVARREATVSSKVTGKVTEVLIEEGLRVEAGQVLARLDDSNIKASLRLAEAQHEAARSALAETRVRLDEAEKELRRVVTLATNHIASASDLDKAEAAVNSLKARLESQRVETSVAEQQVAVWRQQLDDTIICAPFAGIVTAKNAQPGEMISPISAGGGFTRTGIGTIVDMQSLEIEVDVNESYINRVEPGQAVEATLDAYPDWKIPSKVIAIIPTADRQKSTVRVRVGFDRLDARILPQMNVKVAFHGAIGSSASARAVVVPKSAVRKQDGREVVFVVQGDRLERRAVTLGTTRDQEVTVIAGLSGSERLVVEGPEQLAGGERVREKNK